MTVKKTPQEDPPAEEESESGSEFESESEDELIVEGKKACAPQTDNKKPVSEPKNESESSSEEEAEADDDFVVKPTNAKRKTEKAEPSSEGAKRQKKTTPAPESPARKAKKATPAVSKSPAREECWSEEATSTLIEEWGRRYEVLKKLRTKDWKEVVDVVNALHGYRRTEIQCKNRLDTIKKKYKLEKRKSESSSWPFFPRMDFLLGPKTEDGEPMKPEADEEAANSGSDADKKKPKPKPSSKRRLHNGEALKRQTRKETEIKPNGTLTDQNSTPVAHDDWVVPLGELLKESSVPESVWSRGLALISDSDKADLGAQWKEFFLSQLELDAKKDQFTSTLKKLIFEELKKDKQTDDGH